MDVLRSCFSSRFYYGTGDDDWIIGKYCWAAEGAEVIGGTNVFGAPIWRDEWDQDIRPGVSMGDYEWYGGSLMGLKLKKITRQVEALKKDCRGFPQAIPLTSESTMGFPNVCFTEPPVERHGPYFYEATVTDLNVTAIAGTFDLNFTHTLEWTGDSWRAFPLTFFENLTIIPMGSYPDGSGWQIIYERFFDDEGLVTFTWILLLGTYQGDTETQLIPAATAGVVVNSLVSMVLNFVPAEFAFQANPADVFP